MKKKVSSWVKQGEVKNASSLKQSSLNLNLMIKGIQFPVKHLKKKNFIPFLFPVSQSVNEARMVVITRSSFR